MKSNESHLLFLLITVIITLLPLILGVCTWAKLPDTVAIHFGIDGKPNGWAPKWVAVYLIPLVLAVVQLIVYFSMSFAATKSAIGTVFFSFIMLIVPICAIICTVVIYLRALK